ncbi:hypothetical protein BD310DRAFT_663588 [Dichomitus squalens]|uniref:Uncharacterized protein n=1 Tax=Dichomitus squalens TaxID=114155 RepID=A0A4Q9Q7P1_9APHY|nr:hypothetical protein BD310DRAFT_663588 [Dichomitus squalens]
MCTVSSFLPTVLYSYAFFHDLRHGLQSWLFVPPPALSCICDSLSLSLVYVYPSPSIIPLSPPPHKFTRALLRSLSNCSVITTRSSTTAPHGRLAHKAPAIVILPFPCVPGSWDVRLCRTGRQVRPVTSTVCLVHPALVVLHPPCPVLALRNIRASVAGPLT